ncbi:MAG: iron ABC transporter permease [Nitrospirae bacterium]|nr:MAG: iron ABC transporter permease [Nitrospirota bacterium]
MGLMAGPTESAGQKAVTTAPAALATAAADPRAVAGGSSRLSPMRWLLTLSALAATAGLVLLTCMQFGTEHIGFAEEMRIVSLALREGQVGLESAGAAGVILMQVRLPRVLLAFMVGGCLAAVGVGLQALLRNPLADPYVLGISSGAALGAGLAILFGLTGTVLAFSALPLCAMAGGLLSVLVVYRIATSYGYLPIHTLLLAGVILNAIFSALVMFVTSIMEPNRSFGMMSWLMGTLTAPDYSAMLVLAAYLVVGLFVLFRQAASLNLLALGEESARALGVEVEAVKKIVFFTSALLTGAVVSVSGMIGFVGMVIPHAMRLLIGADHRLLLPASALVGGMYLTAADTIARTLLSPTEIPVGVVTALAGGPFFIYLLASRKGRLA